MTDIIERIRVYFPGGNELQLLIRALHIGVFPELKGLFVVMAEQEDKQILALDLRVVIQSWDGITLYNGRELMNEVGFDDDLRDWLAEHPEWPPAELSKSSLAALEDPE